MENLVENQSMLKQGTIKMCSARQKKIALNGYLDSQTKLDNGFRLDRIISQVSQIKMLLGS